MRRICILFAFILFIPFLAFGAEGIKVKIDGKVLESYSNQKPFILDGTTLIPMRIIFEELGATVKWDNDTKSAFATKGDINVKVTEDSDIIFINNIEKKMHLSMRIVNGYTYVPLRAVSEALKCEVLWEEDTKTIEIKTNDNDLTSTDVPIIRNESEVYKKALEEVDTVCYIELFDSKDEPSASGSGVVISEDGLIVTNFHVIEGAYSAKVYFNNNEQYEIDKVLAYDKELDLALVKINAKNLKFAKIGDVNKQKVNDKILTVGSPKGIRNTVSPGIISSFRNERHSNIQITAPIDSGNSGGGLFNLDGELIGITASGFKGYDLNFCIAIDKLEIIKQNLVDLKIYELLSLKNENSKEMLSIEALQGKIIEKYSKIDNEISEIVFSSINLANLAIDLFGYDYVQVNVEIKMFDQDFEKYLKFLDNKKYSISEKMKILEDFFRDMIDEIVSSYNTSSVNIEVSCDCYGAFNGLYPYFAPISPGEYKFDYDEKKYKYEVYILSAIYNNDYSFFHNYDWTK